MTDKKTLLETVTIKGLWDRYDFTLRLHDDVNFLIGVNGSGKTTAINTIAAALTADVRALGKLPFRSIEIKLREIGGRRRPAILVEKDDAQTGLFPSITYRIWQKASERPVTLELPDHNYTYTVAHSRRRQREWYEQSRFQLLPLLEGLISASWLSIHRSREDSMLHDEGEIASRVDRKITDISNELVRFSSTLAARARHEAEEFQKKVFLSLISSEEQEDIVQFARELDVADEQAALQQIFEEFSLPRSAFGPDMRQHFKAFRAAVENLKASRGLSIYDFESMISAKRIHSVVQEWKSTVARQHEIFELRDRFVRVVNEHFQRKSVRVDDRNELTVLNDIGQQLSLTNLSSGEKQLLIILGEALLQGTSPWVYLADEPELSLHVGWQRTLVDSLRVLNPKAQILFATHSPDIVGRFGENTFNMEHVLAT